MNSEEKELQDLKLLYAKDKAEITSFLKENAKDIGLLTKDVKEIVLALSESTEALSSLKSLHKRVDKQEKLLEDYSVIRARVTMISKGLIWVGSIFLGAIILGIIGANIDFK